jgi:hypothetical protein
MLAGNWKYWHACKLHVQALGSVVAYDMYKEVVEEGLAVFGFNSKEEAIKNACLTSTLFATSLPCRAYATTQKTGNTRVTLR